jgi:hypothetical protein
MSYLFSTYWLLTNLLSMFKSSKKVDHYFNSRYVFERKKNIKSVSYVAESENELNSNRLFENSLEPNRTRTGFSKMKSNRTELKPAFRKKRRTEPNSNQKKSVRFALWYKIITLSCT